ncbi:unnamed protein product [Amaranthus hypochondriacus]
MEYELSTMKASTLMGAWVESSWVWHFTWRRRLFDWEEADVRRLEAMIAGVQLHQDKDDGLSWHHMDFHSFPTKSIVDKFSESVAPVLSKACINAIWRNPSPPRAQLTLWMACLEKLKTGDRLVDLGIVAAQDAMCPFCNLVLESHSHLFFSCSFSWKVWMSMLNWRGVEGALQDQCTQFIIAWGSLTKSKRRKKLWSVVMGCCVWSLWFERNKIKFERGVPDLHRFIFSLRVRIGLWAKELLGLSLGSSPLFVSLAPAFAF